MTRTQLLAGDRLAVTGNDLEATVSSGGGVSTPGFVPLQELPMVAAENCGTAPSSVMKKQRLVFLDGLRGLAAVAVVLFHLCLIVHDHIIYTLQPTIFGLVGTYGRLGVQVFFVLSGFVITYSLKNAAVTWRFAGRFILRRSIRLDPPYWFTILLASAVSLTATHLFAARYYDVPSLEEVAVHLFYLQGLLGYRQIVVVFWTLCIEVQFYLAFIALLSVLHMFGRTSQTIQSKSFTVFLCITGAVSLLSSRAIDAPVNCLYEYWYTFCLGALVCRAFLMANYHLATVVVLAAGITSIIKADVNAATASITAGIILASAVLNCLDRWLRDPVSQYFGRISYSLYLIHLVVIPPVINFCYRLDPETMLMSVFASGLSLVVTVMAATMLYWFVERPSVWLARGLKQEKVAG